MSLQGASRSLIMCSGNNHYLYKRVFSHVAKIGPAVRSILDVYRLDFQTVTASGPQGNLLKGDVLKYIEEKGLKPAPITPASLPSGMIVAPPAQLGVIEEDKPHKKQIRIAKVAGEFTDVQLSNIRRIIAKRLTESKTMIPHSYASIDCQMENVTALRNQLKDDEIVVSVNDFIIKAAALALREVPKANVVWSGDTATLAKHIDISVAVATEKGLITPIVTDAIGIGLQEISHRVKDLASRAKSGKLKPDEFQGGTFTISNLGMFGISEFSAVINPPQACILAIGSSRLVLNNSGEAKAVCTVTLSNDVRIVSEDVASKFLEAFKYVMENPMTMLTHKISADNLMDKLFAT